MAQGCVQRDQRARKTNRQNLLEALNLIFPAHAPANHGPALRWSSRLILFAAVLMPWDDGQTLRDRFAKTWRRLAQLFPKRKRPGRTWQGWTKALRRQSPALLRQVIARLRHASQALAQPDMSGWMLYTVDGSRVSLPRVKALMRTFGMAGKQKTSPHAYLTTLMHLNSGLPVDYRVGSARASERGHLKTMSKHLPKGPCWSPTRDSSAMT